MIGYGKISINTCMLLYLSAAIPVHAQNLFMTAPGSMMHRSSLDGSNLELIFEGPAGRSALAVDETTTYLYWYQLPANQIRRVNLLSPGVDETLPLIPLSGPIIAIAVDAGAGLIYWQNSDLIIQSNLDGSAPTPIVQSAIAIRDFVLDRENGRIYWSTDESIQRTDLITHETVTFVAGMPGGDLAIDPLADHLYWHAQGVIRRTNLDDGTNIEMLFSTSFPDNGNCLSETGSKLELDAFHGQLYWGVVRCCDPSGSEPKYCHALFRRSNLDGSNPQTVEDDLKGVPPFTLNSGGTHIYAVLWPVDFGCSAAPSSRLEALPTSGGAWASLLPTVRGTSSWNNHVLSRGSERLLWSDYYAWTESAPDLQRRYECVYSTDFDGTNQLLHGCYGSCGTWQQHARIKAIAYQAPRLFVSTYSNAGWDIGSWLFGVTSTPINLGESVGYDIVPYLEQNLVFWIATPGKIQRATLDSTNVTTIVPSGAVGALAVDPIDEKIVWSTAEGFRHANLDGTENSLFLSLANTGATELAVFPAGRQFFWKNGAGLWRADLDGTNVVHIGPGFSGFFGLGFPRAPAIASSVPPNHAIDARIPHALQDPNLRFGWDTVEVSFAEPITLAVMDSLTVLEVGSGDGIPPTIDSVEVVSAQSLRITFQQPIEPWTWTCIRENFAGTRACFGFLPGDVNADGTVFPVDILELIDHLNGVAIPPYAEWQTDIDRSNVTNPSDVLRLIDLMNGAEAFLPWLGQSLPHVP